MKKFPNIIILTILLSSSLLPLFILNFKNPQNQHLINTKKETVLYQHKSKHLRKVRKFNGINSLNKMNLFQQMQAKYATVNINITLNSSANFDYLIKYQDFDVFGSEHSNKQILVRKNSVAKIVLVGAKLVPKTEIKIGSEANSWKTLTLNTLSKINFQDINSQSINYHIDAAGSKSSPTINLNRSYTKRDKSGKFSKVITDNVGHFNVYNRNKWIHNFFTKNGWGIFIDTLIPIITLHLLGTLYATTLIWKGSSIFEKAATDLGGDADTLKNVQKDEHKNARIARNSKSNSLGIKLTNQDDIIDTRQTKKERKAAKKIAKRERTQAKFMKNPKVNNNFRKREGLDIKKPLTSTKNPALEKLRLEHEENQRQLFNQFRATEFKTNRTGIDGQNSLKPTNLSLQFPSQSNFEASILKDTNFISVGNINRQTAFHVLENINSIGKFTEDHPDVFEGGKAFEKVRKNENQLFANFLIDRPAPNSINLLLEREYGWSKPEFD